MRDFLERHSRTPIFHGQSDLRRDARLLHLVLLGVLGFVTLNTAGLILVYKRKLAVSVFLFALLAIATVCFRLMRRGRAHLASVALVSGLWCLAATRIVLDGGLMGPSSFYFLVVCVFAGLLLGTRGVAICAFFTVVTATGMLMAESLGHPIPQYFFVLPLPSFIAFTCALLFVLVPLNLLLSELKSALGLAERKLRESEEAIALLRESEDRYRDLVEHSEDLLCTHDLEGILLTVNDPPAHILGYTKEELLHRPMRDFVVPEAQALCDAYLAQIQRDGFVKGLLPVLTKNGEVRLWEYNNTLRKEGVNSPIVRGIAHDVTEQKRAEKALRISEEKFSRAFKACPIYMAITTFDEGRFIDVNESFERQTGFARDEVIGRTTLELNMWVNLAERDAVIEDLRSGRQVRSREVQFRTKSGHIRFKLYSAEIIGIGDNRRLLSVCEDITQQKESETALRQSEANYRSLFLQAPYGIYQVTPAGTFLIVNKALVEMLGYGTAEEFCSANREKDIFLDPQDRRRMIEQVQRRDDDNDFEFYWKRKDGGSILVRVKSRICRNGNGEIEYYERSAEDITQKKAVEKHIQQMQRMEAIGLLAGGIAHDFNNLLTGILGNAELVLKSLGPTNPSRSRLETVVAAVIRGRDLTGKVLAFSQGESLPLYPINLDEEIQQMEGFIRAMVEENIDIGFDLSLGSARVLLGTNLLYQILMNLAVNSKDAMPRGGKLRIRTTLAVIESDGAHPTGVPQGRYACMEFSDTGHGMDKALLDRIFDPFFTTKKTGKGTGLGLYTVFGIVRQCSGHIRVSSEIGKGSAFETYFPVVDLPVPKESEIPESPSEGEAREVILLVEDDAPVRNAVRDQLADLGYLVLCESNPVQALRDAEGFDVSFDLLLSDVVMPDISGPDLARRLKEKRPSLKVLYMTGYAREDVLQLDDLDAGTDLLRKPFTQVELNEKIRHLLSFGPQ